MKVRLIHLYHVDTEELPGGKIQGEISATRFARQSFVAVKAGSKMMALMIFEGTCHSGLFETWVEQVLLPELIPGQTVVMDNATFHKSLKKNSDSRGWI